MAKANGLRLYKLKLYGSEAGVGARVNQIIYSSWSRKNRNKNDLSSNIQV